MDVTIATFNIYNHADFDERVPAIIKTLERLDADVICLQEVPPQGGRTAEIAGALGYPQLAECVFVRPDDGWSEALAVLSKHPLTAREAIDLRPGVPNCLRAVLYVGGKALAVYNTHLHPRDSALRQREAAIILEHVSSVPDVPAVLCGDFNAVPSGQTMGVVWPQLRSAFELAAGYHPDSTFPTPLRPLSARTPGFSARREAPPTDDESDARAAIDYILIRPGQFRARDARVIGGQVGGVWPSDHYGLAVTLVSG